MFNLLSTASISPLLISYGYLILFPICVIEGPIATIIAGFLVSLGYFNFALIYLIAFLGDIGGDIIYYAIGRWGTKRVVSKGKFLGISIEHAKRLEGHFEKHAGKTLIFGKLTHSIGGAILLAAGMAKMDFKKFILFNSIASVPKVLIFMLIGYYFGAAYRQIDRYFGIASFSILVAVVLIVAVYLLVKNIRKKEKLD